MAARYPAIAKALARMPEDTVIDGEIVALDADGRPSFNLLQNYGNSTGPLVHFVFDILMLKGRDLKNETLETKRGAAGENGHAEAGRSHSPFPALDGGMKQLIKAVKEGGLEGLHPSMRRP